MARRVSLSPWWSWCEVKRYVQDGARWCYLFLLVSCLFTGLESRSTEPVSTEYSDHSPSLSQPLSSLVAPFPQFVRAKLLPQISDRKTKSDAMDIPDTAPSRDGKNNLKRISNGLKPNGSLWPRDWLTPSARYGHHVRTEPINERKMSIPMQRSARWSPAGMPMGQGRTCTTLYHPRPISTGLIYRSYRL